MYNEANLVEDAEMMWRKHKVFLRYFEELREKTRSLIHQINKEIAIGVMN